MDNEKPDAPDVCQNFDDTPCKDCGALPGETHDVALHNAEYAKRRGDA